jgi:hypothetical protein
VDFSVSSMHPFEFDSSQRLEGLVVEVECSYGNAFLCLLLQFLEDFQRYPIILRATIEDSDKIIPVSFLL